MALSNVGAVLLPRAFLPPHVATFFHLHASSVLTNLRPTMPKTLDRVHRVCAHPHTLPSDNRSCIYLNLCLGVLTHTHTHTHTNKHTHTHTNHTHTHTHTNHTHTRHTHTHTQTRTHARTRTHTHTHTHIHARTFPRASDTVLPSCGPCSSL